MADELSQLDELIESDMLEALGKEVPKTKDLEEENIENSSIDTTALDELEGIIIEDFNEEVEEKIEEETNQPIETLNEIKVEQESNQNDKEDDLEEEAVENFVKSKEDIINETKTNETINISSDSIASIFKELLKNKTIEITIKIKD